MTMHDKLMEDLLTLEPSAFYLKHIVKSHNWYFSSYLHIPQDEIVDKMDYFNEIVSSSLKINFHSLQIVGSAKTGYSLSPRNVLRPFHEQAPDTKSSDIDIAIVSERLYLKFWSELRQVKGIQYDQYYYNHLTASIFRGFINDKDLLKIKGPREEWEDMTAPINVLLQDKLGFEHPITYRLYRSWDDLEEYQIIGISKARAALEGKKSV